MTALTASADPIHADPVVLRCTDTADFLAALPFLTGFTADDSLFIVLFSGRRTEAALRIDLPARLDPAHTDPLLDGICTILRESGAGAEGPAMVITSTRRFADEGGAPWRRFAGMIRRRLRREGWGLRELAVVAPDGWAGLLDPDGARHPRPLSEIDASPIAAQAAATERAPVRLGDLGRVPEPDARRTAAVQSHLAELDARGDRCTGPLGSARLHGIAHLAGACVTAPRADDPCELEPRLCARLIRASERIDSWLVLACSVVERSEFVVDMLDAVPLTTLVGLPVVAADALTDDPATRPPRDLATFLTAMSHERPDIGQVNSAIRVLLDTTAHAPVHRRPGLLALLAWSWWMRGTQTVAVRSAEEALDIAPDHEIARFMRLLVEAPPSWPFARSVGDPDQS